MDDDKFILYKEYYLLADAYLEKGLLETNGVKCIIENEIMSSVYPITHTSLGSIRLLLRESDKEKADIILGSQSSEDSQ